MFRNEILENYQIRKTKRQKKAFADYLKGLLHADGIEMEVRECGSFKSKNLMVGDLTGAKVLFTAHYDTPAVMPVPNFITPCNMVVYLLYQVLLVLGFFAIGAVVVAVLTLLGAGFWVCYLAELITIFGLLFLLIAGPANKHNANDNTSGVLALIKLIREMPEDVRAQCAFIFFDHEEAGLLGSSSLAQKYKNDLKTTPVFNMDCIGEGENILFVYHKKNCKELVPLLESLQGDEKYKVVVKSSSKALYPSDHASFKCGVGIAAMNYKKGLGLYLSRLHTKNDTVCRFENIDFVTQKLQQVARDLTAQ